MKHTYYGIFVLSDVLDGEVHLGMIECDSAQSAKEKYFDLLMACDPLKIDFRSFCITFDCPRMVLFKELAEYLNKYHTIETIMGHRSITLGIHNIPLVVSYI
jgi:hypothetical protein